MSGDLLTLRPESLYCPAGGFHLDPLRVVERAVVTHADADPLPFAERRARLEAWIARHAPERTDLSAPIPFERWDELAEMRADARLRGEEARGGGRPRGDPGSDAFRRVMLPDIEPAMFFSGRPALFSFRQTTFE